MPWRGFNPCVHRAGFAVTHCSILDCDYMVFNFLEKKNLWSRRYHGAQSTSLSRVEIPCARAWVWLLAQPRMGWGKYCGTEWKSQQAFMGVCLWEFCTQCSDRKSHLVFQDGRFLVCYYRWEETATDRLNHLPNFTWLFLNTTLSKYTVVLLSVWDWVSLLSLGTIFF